MNGSSSSRQKDVAASSSQQRYKGRLALKRRAGAAAKAAQKYADFEVRVFAHTSICTIYACVCMDAVPVASPPLGGMVIGKD